VALRLRLGPVVGHTDHGSATVWIQAPDHPGRYKLRVAGVGRFDFASTEQALEFGTGIAVASGLAPDRVYRYSVLRRGRQVARARGSFRTMPLPGSMAPILFCAISCNQTKKAGLWEKLAAFVEKAKPHFVVMMGDQVYVDEDEPDVFKEHLDSPRPLRRRVLADVYRKNWSREPVRKVLANFPTYMIWDDHDIRDGWASVASDSPTMAARYPRGRRIFAKTSAFYEDCRDVYWHFQGCHNPRPTGDPALPNYVFDRPGPGQRGAMPFVFRCGRLVVLVLDQRGDRDVFRADLPILGSRQWQFVEDVYANLGSDVDALAVVTGTPMASMDPDGQVMNLLGDRTDDVDAFAKGDEQESLHPKSSSSAKDLPVAIANVHLSRLLGTPLNLGRYMVSKVDEARDQWSHKFARPEQLALLRKSGEARTRNATPGTARELVFLSGDIHVGAIYEISSMRPAFKATSVTSSGIAADEEQALILGTFLDEGFAVGFGIRSRLVDVVNDFNFGVINVIPKGNGAEITSALAHEGASWSFGVDLAALVR
jgi:hypothetical protein